MPARLEYGRPVPMWYARQPAFEDTENADWMVAAQVVYMAQRRPSEPYPGPSDCCALYWPQNAWVALEEAERAILQGHSSHSPAA